jgi:peptidoglycan/xylan/chitin deacetylase (PgdA/CDA1 family)
MNRRVTILMYHYVRDLARSRYPEIKGLDVRLFREQIGYVTRHYHVIRMEELTHAVRNPSYSLPPAALLLTFDDGFADHYDNVLPVLQGRGIQGSFYPPVHPIVVGEVLDVHKIHFILASCPDKSALVAEMAGLVEEYREEYGLEAPDVYRARVVKPHHLDTPDVVFVKRLLQMGFAEEPRALITDRLFMKHVTTDEKAFAEELYMTPAEIRALSHEGMHVGCHGYRHYWMDTLSPDRQDEEIRLSLEFFTAAGLPTRDWTICYPYGKCNESLMTVVERHGCSLGMVDYGGIADLDRQSRLTLARLATNELPVERDAAANAWTVAVAGA